MLISVLIPTYNSARFVRGALDSVLAQTRHDWEVVLVDNASDDGTFEIAREYAARDPRVRVFRNPVNVGPVRNWRRCAEEARGDLAALLFSDDWYEPEFLAKAVPLMGEDVGFVYSAVRLVERSSTGEERGAPKLWYALERTGVFPSSRFAAEIFEHRRNAVPVSPGCAVMRRADLRRWLERGFRDEDAVGYLRHGAGPDLAVYVQAIKEYPAFGHVREPLVSFLSHEANLTKQPIIAAAYARAGEELFEWGAPWPGVDAQRVWANLAAELRKTDRLRPLLRRLGPRGWWMFGARAFRWVGRKARVRVRGPSQPA